MIVLEIKIETQLELAALIDSLQVMGNNFSHIVGSQVFAAIRGLEQQVKDQAALKLKEKLKDDKEHLRPM